MIGERVEDRVVLRGNDVSSKVRFLWVHAGRELRRKSTQTLTEGHESALNAITNAILVDHLAARDRIL